MNFASPERLWIAAAIPLLLLVVWLLKRRQRMGARVVSLLLRSTAIAMLAVGAAEPTRDIVEKVATRTILVMDASRSVDNDARGRASDAVEAWTRAGRRVDVWAFGENTTFIGSFGPGPSTAAIPWLSGAMGSDVAPALAESLTAAPNLDSVSLVVATDGAVDRIPQPVRDVAKSWLVTTASARRNSVRLLSAKPTSTPLENEPYELVVEGECTDGVKGEFGLFVDGRDMGKAPIDGPAGSFTIKMPMPPLARGRHVIGVVARTRDTEPLDDSTGCVVHVKGSPHVLVLAPGGSSQVASALAAQGLELRVDDGSSFEAALDAIAHQGAVVVDRMPVSWMSSEGVSSRLLAYVRRGGGLVVIPPGGEGAMAPSSAGSSPAWLPFSGMELPKPSTPPDPPPKPPHPPEEGLKPPDPENRNTEKRRAPSLGMLLLIDCSGSMKGQKLRLAKEAAIAASEVLHEEDRIGVVAFSDRPLEVLPMTRAGDRTEVVDRIARITSSGGTDFVPALDLAKDILESENLSIKHVVLISDGESKPGRFRPRVEALRAIGATVTTIGVGYEADANTLTDIAVAGGSKYLQADSEREIPQLLVIEAERVIAATGARKREAPKVPTEGAPRTPAKSPSPPLDRPKPPPTDVDDLDVKRFAIRPNGTAGYLRGIDWESSKGVAVKHPVKVRSGAWVTLISPDGSPLFAHRHEGFGQIAMAAFALEGAEAGDLPAFGGLSSWLAQVVRYVAASGKPERFAVGIESLGRTFRVTVKDLESDGVAPTGLTLRAKDAFGRAVELTTTETRPGSFDVSVPAEQPNGILDLLVSAPTLRGDGVGAVLLPPPREVLSRGGSAEGLTGLAEALKATMVPQFPLDPGPDAPTRHRREPISCSWLWVLLPMLLADIVILRLWPPRRA